MESIDLREIEKAETKNIIKNPDWFYHGFDFGNLANILENGLLAKKHLGYKNGNIGLNGKHYISVAKDIDHEWPALRKYRQQGPLMIMDDINAIECKYKKLYYYLRFTALPFRYTEWPDEYQVYSKISPDKFIALECMVYEWAKTGNIFLLKRLHYMLKLMQELNCELPIYDFSRQDGDTVHELDKEAYYELSKRMIN